MRDARRPALALLVAAAHGCAGSRAPSPAVGAALAPQDAGALARGEHAEVPSAAAAPSEDAAGAGQAVAVVALPGGEHGIGFDDLRTEPATGSVFVPAGVTGRVFAIDPTTHALAAYDGLAHGTATRGHGNGPTSVDLGPGALFVADRTSRTVDVVDRATRALVARARLGGGPDYVRYVAATNELWVTEPSAARIEVLDLAPFTTARAAPRFARAIPVPGGPESLEIDAARGRAYTHVWTGARTLALDLATHAVVSNWASGCRHDDTQGLALDPDRGQLFVGCADGTVTALDVASGRPLGRASVGAGVDIIAYNRALHHLYVPSADAGTLGIVGVAPSGALRVLGVVPAAVGAHCAATDQRRAAYVCDPRGGRVLVIDDAYPGD